MGGIAFRAEPVAVIGESINVTHRLRVGMTSRQEQEQPALTQLAKLAIACGVGTLGYHGDLLSRSIALGTTRIRDGWWLDV
jgi:hypothetical protein